MNVTIAGVSALGVRLSYGIEEIKGQKPVIFILLPRINQIS